MRISQAFHFDAGHRVLGHSGKCAHLHGHRYTAMLEVGSTKLTSLGMVIDFGELKEKVGRWINDHWDHNMILHKDDPLAKIWESADERSYRTAMFGGKKPYIMPESAAHPTAENMAKELLVRSAAILCGTGLHISKVLIW